MKTITSKYFCAYKSFHELLIKYFLKKEKLDIEFISYSKKKIIN